MYTFHLCITSGDPSKIECQRCQSSYSGYGAYVSFYLVPEYWSISHEKAKNIQDEMVLGCSGQEGIWKHDRKKNDLVSIILGFFNATSGTS